MVRIAILAVAIGSLALTSCRTPQHAPENAPQAAVPRDVPSAHAEPVPAAAPLQAPQSAQPAPTTPTPTAPSPAVPPVAAAASSTPKPSSPKTAPPAAKEASPPVAGSKAPLPASAAAPEPAKPADLDLNALEQRLKDTRAIGVFTKLSLKNQVDDLLSEFRAYHKGSSKTPQSVLRQKFDLLILKVLSLLQDGDPQLASAIASSRETLWGILLDPQKFAKI
jgi:hypothetical protein